MVNKLFLIAILIFGSYVYAQQSDSKRTQSDIPGSNSVGRNSDLAYGEDTYKLADRTFDEVQWKNDKYNRQKVMPPYRITNSQYVSRSTIKRSINTANEVKIRIMQNGHDNTDIEDFSLAYDSGNEYRMSNIHGIQNTSLPLYVKVTYRSWNVFHAVQFDVTFEFTIYHPGTWDVTIFN